MHKIFHILFNIFEINFWGSGNENDFLKIKSINIITLQNTIQMKAFQYL